MAKRFSETDKWQDEWFSALEPIEKLVWIFLCDKCDNAGFFEVNARVNSFLVGIQITEYLGAIEGLNRGLIISKNGKKGFIKKFLFHQKNLPLNPENNAHRQIIGLAISVENEFDYDFTEYLGAYKGLLSPIGKGTGKGNGRGKEESGEKKIDYPVKLYQTIHEAIAAESSIYENWVKKHSDRQKEYLVSAVEDSHLKNIKDGIKGLSAEMFLAAVSRNILNGWTPGDRKNGQHNGTPPSSINDHIKALREKEKNGTANQR